MARIEWVEQRLEAWGAWVRVQRAVDLGYGESPIARLVRANIQQPIVRAGDEVVPAEDHLALEVERALSAIDRPGQRRSRRSDVRLADVAVLAYVVRWGTTSIGQHYRSSRSTAGRWLERLHEELAVRLAQGQWRVENTTSSG